MAAIFRFIVFNPFTDLLLIGLIAAGISLSRASRPLTKRIVVQTLLSYQILFSIGIAYIINFILHAFYGTMMAAILGWPNSPFQTEVAFASLGYAVLGLLAFRGSEGMRVAAVISVSCFLLGAEGVHIYDIITRNNFAPGNTGLILVTDLVVPLLCLTLLYMELRLTHNAQATAWKTKPKSRVA